MNRKTVSGIMLTLLLPSMLAFAFSIQPARASGTIYISADGSVEPDTAPISSVDNVTYTFTDNIYEEIVVKRDNIVVDGADYTVKGTRTGHGITLSSGSNVTIKNVEIKAFGCGILLCYSSNNSISGNNITSNVYYGISLNQSSNSCISGNNIANNWRGISLFRSSNNGISGNNVANNWHGIYLGFSSTNSISGNDIANNWQGILLEGSSANSIAENNITTNNGGGISLWCSPRNSISESNVANNGCGIYLGCSRRNSISENNIANNWRGFYLDDSSENWISGNDVASNGGGISLVHSRRNSISENNIANNGYGIKLWYSSNSIIYHNNFINNTNQVYSYVSINTWDDGYPSGGNFWSDYEEIYPNAKEIDDSGVWNTPYVIDENNQDNYPLIEPWSPLPRTIGELKTKIEEMGLEDEIDNQGIVKSLIAKLNVAQKLVDEGKIDEAISILEEDFIPQVQNLSDIHITKEVADILIKSAEYIISHL